jgi:sulfatase modifying factor 1
MGARLVWAMAGTAAAAGAFSIAVAGCQSVLGLGSLRDRSGEDASADATSEDAGVTADAPTSLDSAPDGADAGPPASDAATSDGDADADAGPPSCALPGVGRTDCGPLHEDCCLSPPVDGGTYSRTYTNDGGGPTGEADPATVSDFRLDKYLVTVGRFRPFVDAWRAGFRPAVGAGKHAHLNHGLGVVNGASPGSYEPGWDPADDTQVSLTDADLECSGSPGNETGTWTPSEVPDAASFEAGASGDDLPITCVTWPEAYAFCIWDGAFLATEAEFEYAAAGGLQQREYPWGTLTPSAADTTNYVVYDCLYASDAGACVMAVAPPNPNAAPVGTASAGIGLYGQLDLNGNATEWLLDWLGAAQPYFDPCVDCAALETELYRTTRGVGFDSNALQQITLQRLDSWHRDGLTPDTRTDNLGFRCARSP